MHRKLSFKANLLGIFVVGFQRKASRNPAAKGMLCERQKQVVSGKSAICKFVVTRECEETKGFVRLDAKK
jgi:hypothetical protein